MVKENGSFQPGQIKSRTQPLSTSKWSEVVAANDVFVLYMMSFHMSMSLMLITIEKTIYSLATLIYITSKGDPLNSYLPSPWIELIRPIIVIFIKMN